VDDGDPPGKGSGTGGNPPTTSLHAPCRGGDPPFGERVWLKPAFSKILEFVFFVIFFWFCFFYVLKNFDFFFTLQQILCILNFFFPFMF
jgi:hypothetical protein